MMARKPQEEFKEDPNRWLTSYSDMISLLLVFFVILLSMSTFNVEQVETVSQSIREGLTGTPIPTLDIPPYWTEEGDEYDEFVRKLMDLITSSGGVRDSVDIKLDDRGVVISFKDHALFRSGSAELSQQAQDLIDQIGSLLTHLDYSFILVEGHTDTDPIKTARYQDNMDLSTQRASNVWRRLVAAGNDPKKIASIGYGEYRPVAPNDSPENKAKNRRVVITILRAELIASDEFVLSESLGGTVKN